ncbi:WLM-domain-containing protein [Hypoxylon trugodes]|uniref:WLM-domain-containing protein n=1 Tax=Hypoxylon trugodes TaxID=326681 RepID=UPI0021919745|nr:WLM-domain-containing protein [Hypoxylon trugodes]KAI1394127.1 WLM-domain-containing protein [Hypoxylon trugodes]
MPSGFERINSKKSQPNDRIVFIKPLEGPDKEIAQDFLERIAAQCLPVMREHHLIVTALEEYEPNREFVGRNFNGGEVIQLVLKSQLNGRWLPFNYVQMVMMHELAHCKQMNHSKAFWAVRNKYANEMKVLWSRGYTGEGLWGKGSVLGTGDLTNTIQSDAELPEHTCGGTYRSQPRKRRPKKQLTYQERKERRILKKFGANGVVLGADDDIKTELEQGKKNQTKPRVAKSKRGRELRAAAALARFDQHKKAEATKSEDADIKEEDDSDYETASDDENEAAVDINGRRLVDKKGHNLIKVCDDEDPNDDEAQNELRELFQTTLKVKIEDDGKSTLTGIQSKTQKTTSRPLLRAKSQAKLQATPQKSQPILRLSEKSTVQTNVPIQLTEEASSGTPTVNVTETQDAKPGICTMCSFDNGPDVTICGVCSHVMDLDKVPNTWKCQNSSCKDTMYLNAGDSGACGLCGQLKDAK